MSNKFAVMNGHVEDEDGNIVIENPDPIQWYGCANGTIGVGNTPEEALMDANDAEDWGGHLVSHQRKIVANCRFCITQ